MVRRHPAQANSAQVKALLALAKEMPKEFAAALSREEGVEFKFAGAEDMVRGMTAGRASSVIAAVTRARALRRARSAERGEWDI